MLSKVHVHLLVVIHYYTVHTIYYYSSSSSYTAGLVPEPCGYAVLLLVSIML